jgi:8-oxo-dGTP diphosphatase
MRRELREELGVDADVGDEVFQVSHDYEDRRVELHFMRCVVRGTPQPLLGQEMQWAIRDELGRIEFPPADAELIRLLLKRQR